MGFWIIWRIDSRSDKRNPQDFANIKREADVTLWVGEITRYEELLPLFGHCIFKNYSLIFLSSDAKDVVAASALGIL